MNNNYLLAIIFLVTGIFSNNLFSQETISVNGNTILTQDGSVSFTIGQLRIGSFTSDSGLAYEGVQQPFELLTLSTESPQVTNDNLSIFPNPADKYFDLQLDLETFGNRPIDYELINSNGHGLIKNRVTNSTERIDVNHLSPGIYLLRVLEDNFEIKVFKVIIK